MITCEMGYCSDSVMLVQFCESMGTAFLVHASCTLNRIWTVRQQHLREFFIPWSTQVSQLNSQSPKHPLCASMIQTNTHRTILETWWNGRSSFWQGKPFTCHLHRALDNSPGNISINKSLQVLGNLVRKCSIMRTETGPQHLHSENKIGAP